MARLIEACAGGEVDAQIAVVVSPREGTPACERARDMGIDVVVLSPKQDEYARDLVRLLNDRSCRWICLCGYMTLLPSDVLRQFPNRVLNIHPALLPRFGGKGMYGHHVHEAVLAAGEKESGATVHLVTERYDEGEIVLQLRCEVRPDDTPESLAARVLGLEHAAYPLALAQVIERERRQA